ncbi:thioesterase domain-containing protein [Streptomyces sp. ACA25]|uniref:thioesterase II family protein n=1 Tax=Streptomyces sp. ACA25 TaxID=3022596 RepID=UPI00230817CE|nr:thioesterase domain-containing protein [Streptomyces sp. ACA25]MDB1089351.1 thioesterase domain-containing protein [Streptomyces sp. ACA25]
MTEDPITLLCFHHAGGSPSAFRAWRGALGPRFELHAVPLPSRDARTGERAHDDLRSLVEALDSELDDLMSRPHMIFGHSMGALVGYWLVQRRMARGAPLPLAYLAAAYAAPHLARSVVTGVDVDRVDDRTLAERLSALGGLPQELLARPEWLRLVLGTVRADLRVCAGHRFIAAPALPVPVHVFGGRHDPLVDAGQLHGWRRHAAAGFGLDILEGGHFLVQDASAGLLDVLRDRLEELAAPLSSHLQPV